MLTGSLLPGGWHLRGAHPVALAPYGEPEPDVAVVVGSSLDYAAEHPTAAQNLLLVEVSDSTVAFDLGRKAQEYAAAGVAHYWVLVGPEQVVMTMTEPVRAPVTPQNPVGWVYGRQERRSIGQEVAVPIAGAQPIAVVDLLPLIAGP